jgi:hypothetical protein
MPIKKIFLTFLATLVGEGRMTIDDFFGSDASSQHFCWRISGAGVAEVYLGGVKAV